MSPRTVLLGVAGLGFDQVRRYVNQGLCPNFQELNRRGYTAGLVTVVPSRAAPAWASLVTGKEPGRHGIFGSGRSEYAAPGSCRRLPVDSRYLAARALPLWDILEQNGIACGLYRVPFTSPPPRVSGFCVGAADADGTGAGDEIIREMFGAPPGDFPAPLDGWLRGMAREREEILGLLRSRREVPFQFYASTALDDLQHRYTRFADEANPAGHDSDESEIPARLRTVVPAAHCWYDRLAGELRAELGPDDTLIVFSPFGNSPALWRFSLNRWLRQEGYLAAPGAESNGDPLDRVDWERTRACAIPGYGLILNRAGREPRGTVGDAEYPRLRDELAAALRVVRRPGCAEPVMRVHLPEEIYRGPFVARAPDLIVTSNAPASGGVIVTRDLPDLAAGSPFVPALPGAGAHDSGEEAVILAAGPGFQRAPGAPGPFRLTDLVPTLCLRFGIPLPDDSDGWFYANLAPGRPRVVLRPYPPAGSDLAPGEARELAERLRGLGEGD